MDDSPSHLRGAMIGPMASEPNPEGAWVFLSHSHLDLAKVRQVRNALEAKGHNPLMFFLKCLDDDAGLDDLIRREIEARTWFLLCQSPNARASRWVQEEVGIIKSLEGKVYEEIDLDDDLESQVESVVALSRRATVFISYSRYEREVALSDPPTRSSRTISVLGWTATR